MKNEEKTIWYIFYLYLFTALLNIFGILFHFQLFNNSLFRIILPTYLPLFVLILYAFHTLSIPRNLFFIILASLMGLFFEIYGLSSGTFFGGEYIYNLKMQLVFGVPFLIILYWIFFIYLGYSITNSFLYWFNKNKPNKNNPALFLLAMLIVGDGLTVTTIDLFMDPIQVKAGAWVWLHGGAYFGVPLGNFVGWFIVTIVVTATFRLFEYFYPQKFLPLNKPIFLIPIMIYTVFAFSYALSAIQFGLYNLAFVGSFIMFSLISVNLYFYKNY
ncbi:MAG: carotenoid biosynthesis protein [Candidatus Zambryskibacteria bacterium]|nr:carotenoid biosynthesis protein [Candidatus Zambryskibacteria bacterium]